MQAGDRTTAAVMSVIDRFAKAYGTREIDAVMAVFARARTLGPGVVVEAALLLAGGFPVGRGAWLRIHPIAASRTGNRARSSARQTLEWFPRLVSSG